MMNVPFYSLDYVNRALGDALRESFSDVLDSKWFIRGSRCAAFEESFAAYCGKKACVGVGNGLDALTLMLKASILLGRMAEGDEVIVPANTFVATVLAVRAAGLVPVLVEPNPETCVLDASRLTDACSARTRAVLVVHLYGRLADMPAICEFAKAHNLLVFEDAAQAHGAVLDENKLSSNAAAYSFYPTKNLGAMGDGGAVVTDDQELAQVVRSLGNYGSYEKYVNKYVGVNSRLDEVQAAVLLAKLPHLDSWNRRRQEIAARYCSEIKNPLVRVTPVPANPKSHVWHVFPVFCERRDDLHKFLKERGIETLIHYPIPPHLQEAFDGALSRGELRYGPLPIAEELARTELSIPIGPGMTDEQVAYVVESINAFA
ncbi:dTDP-4-amino-4,6-dideoxygalactose transaminase [Fibrobacter sp. UWB8]|uniref:DegT/DnrJ/EryC1/StrS family aminotransferase n=1 Tax=unclassified Fibrobacter TaxID=2634177 RepID=UPI000910B6AB|nr:MULTISPECIES: DegT/DnrJ/EryC1/StrS family aminotransferase [unclassified Fibrobacter]PWJ65798.1 dTDP-4-amino-4,6-dideoxygalactose transaminase [Fibrobacter sp. UWB6]SHF93114.1 dTDP-4-amino-4,6-dideoxygalactose transaminase [Fibrobacter sp. UWB8]